MKSENWGGGIAIVSSLMENPILIEERLIKNETSL
jgi:hypothetical protein